MYGHLSLQQTEKYACDDKDRSVIPGKMALPRRGMDFAKTQITSAIQHFSAATNGDFSKFAETYESDTAETESDDSDNSDAESYDPRAELSDAIVREIVGVAEAVFFPEGDVSCWMFPEDFCQSSIDARNGSNACSIISIAIAHAFLDANIQLPTRENLPSLD